MARRKRKRFGSPPEIHRQKLRANATEIRHLVPMLRKNLADGECGRAFVRLKLLLRAEGEFIADRRAVSRATFPRKGGIMKQLEPLASQFVKKCMI